MTDDSYHITICIGIGIGISIGKIFSSVLGVESIGKKWYRSTFNVDTLRMQHFLTLNFICQTSAHIDNLRRSFCSVV